MVRQLCDRAFTRDFGPYSHACGHFLHQAVHAAMRLRFDLLHTEQPYAFKFDDGGDVETQNRIFFDEQQDADWRVVFPSLQSRDRTVVKGVWVKNEPDCGRCRAGTSSTTTE